MYKKLLLVFLLIGSNQAWAAKWTNVANLNGMSLDVDSYSILPDPYYEKGIKVWLRLTIPKTPETIKSAGMLITQESIDCSKRESRVLVMQTYDEKGTYLGENRNATPSKPIAPDSLDENILEYLCPLVFPADFVAPN